MPISSFPFPTYHSDTGTGSGYRNRKESSPLLKDTTTILLATRLASPSWLDGPTSLSPGPTIVRESWTAPLDVERVRPTQDANEVAAEQVKAFVRLSAEEEGVAPLFVFDAGYDPVKVQQGLEGIFRARSSSVCERDAASTPIRVSLVHLPTLGDRVATDRR